MGVYNNYTIVRTAEFGTSSYTFTKIFNKLKEVIESDLSGTVHDVRVGISGSLTNSSNSTTYSIPTWVTDSIGKSIFFSRSSGSTQSATTLSSSYKTYHGFIRFTINGVDYFHWYYQSSSSYYIMTLVNTSKITGAEESVHRVEYPIYGFQGSIGTSTLFSATGKAIIHTYSSNNHKLLNLCYYGTGAYGEGTHSFGTLSLNDSTTISFPGGIVSRSGFSLPTEILSYRTDIYTYGSSDNYSLGGLVNSSDGKDYFHDKYLVGNVYWGVSNYGVGGVVPEMIMYRNIAMFSPGTIINLDGKYYVKFPIGGVSRCGDATSSAESTAINRGFLPLD